MMDNRNNPLETIIDGMFLTATISNRCVFAHKARGEESGLTAPKIVVLSILTKKGPETISKMASYISCSKQNMTTIVDQLEHDGMVERVPDKKDRRATLLKVTKAGVGALHDDRELAKERLKDELSQLDEKEIESLNEAFGTILRVLPLSRFATPASQNSEEKVERSHVGK